MSTPMRSQMQMPVRIALVSASPLVRAGLRAVLERAGEFDVVALAASFAELGQTATDAFDVIVAEYADEPDDLEGAGVPLVLLVRDEDAVSDDALTQGTSLLRHDAPDGAIVAAVYAAAAGLVTASPELFRHALRQARAPAIERDPLAEPLTARETEVLQHLAQGLGNKEIGASLKISAHTAKFHVAQILGKLNASSRGHAVAKALKAGLLRD